MFCMFLREQEGLQRYGWATPRGLVVKHKKFIAAEPFGKPIIYKIAAASGDDSVCRTEYIREYSLRPEDILYTAPSTGNGGCRAVRTAGRSFVLRKRRPKLPEITA